jgi:hypothetical protein
VRRGGAHRGQNVDIIMTTLAAGQHSFTPPFTAGAVLLLFKP